SIDETTRSTWWTPVERTVDLPVSARAAQFLRPAVANGTPDGARIEASFDQLLPQLALARQPQEEPGERDERDDRALDHHHAAGNALVLEGGDSPQPALVDVHRVEDAAGPEEDVPEHRLDDPHDGDVAELRAGAEPLRSGQGLDDGQPHDQAAGEEADVLQRVHAVVPERRVV